MNALIHGRTAPRSGARKWYEIQNAAKDEADVYVYDAIAWWGVDASQFVKDLAAIKAGTINVRINSPGGVTFDAWAIYQALRAHKARIVVHIDGVAASAATVIALAGDEIRMARGALFMIHRPYVLAIGNADEMRKTIDLLLKVEGSLEQLYADKSDLSLEEVRAAMADETWYTAAEAKSAGFVDVIVDGNDAVENHAAHEIMSHYRNVPEAIARAAETRAEGGDREQPQTIREFEAFLRDEGGFSNTAAKKIAAAGFGAMQGLRDEGGEDPAQDAPQGEPEASRDDAADHDALLARLLTARLDFAARNHARSC